MGLPAIFNRLAVQRSCRDGWVESGTVILPLRRVAARLSRLTERPVVANLDGDTPVVLGIDGSDPDLWDLEVALRRSGLSLKVAPDGIEVTGRCIPDHLRKRSSQPADGLPFAAGDGISTGLVVASGRFIDGPYVVSVDGDEVIVNGVSIFPPRPVFPDGETEDEVGAEERRRTARCTWEAISELYSVIRNEPDATAVEWRNEHHVLIHRRDGSVSLLAEGAHDRVSPTAEDRRRLASLVAAGIERSLRKGEIVLSGIAYLSILGEEAPESLRSRVEAIVHDREPDPLRVARLQVHTGDRLRALDVLFGAVE